MKTATNGRGFMSRLTLSHLAFILEMSLSKPNETRLSRMAVTAFPSAKMEGQPSLQS